MNQLPLQGGSISLTTAQLFILQRVYLESKTHPQVFVLEKNLIDWDVLSAYTLLERTIAQLPSGKSSVEYKLAPMGSAFMKALGV